MYFNFNFICQGVENTTDKKTNHKYTSAISQNEFEDIGYQQKSNIVHPQFLFLKGFFSLFVTHYGTSEACLLFFRVTRAILLSAFVFSNWTFALPRLGQPRERPHLACEGN